MITRFTRQTWLSTRATIFGSLILPLIAFVVWRSWAHSPMQLSSALKHAIDTNDVAGVRGLLRAGADPNGQVYTDDRRGMLQRLTDALAGMNVRPTPTGTTFLTYAAYCSIPQRRGAPDADNFGVVKALVEAGAKVNGPLQRMEMSPIIAAAAFRRPKTMKVLLDHGADPNTSITDAYGTGDTPLNFAASGGMLDIVEMLIQHGANPNARTSRGMTPLISTLQSVGEFDHEEDKRRAYEVARFLLRHGATPDGISPDGTTLEAIGRWNANTHHDYRLLELVHDYRRGKFARVGAHAR
jgi:hypothetical protein